ncbi:MAG: hypothetical protein IJ165_05650 [Proteobacteria bacterium]|nr:hypothetical protein [Pseudomonadota bacterium]
MKRVLLCLFILFFLSGCDDAQKRFCREAAESLCDRCASCGGDFTACGLKHASNKTECVDTLKHVCSAYDSLYNKEAGRACLQGLSSLNCEQLKTEGKPEICTRLF